MESSLQKIIAAIVGILILFIIPVYIAFEKVDDISYSLVLKTTQNFVDTIREKGYISPDMYNEYVSSIHATNNLYDIQIEHVRNRYDPAIYIYDLATKETLHTLDYDKYIDELSKKGSITLNEGIYNEYNAKIVVTDPSITFSDGGKIDEIEPETLYKSKIDEYRQKNGIILNAGEIYADVDRNIDGDYFTKSVYKPANITTFDGSIIINNRQGLEDLSLNYDTYIKKYDNKFLLESEYGEKENYFYGPKYDESNSAIKYTKASMNITGKEYSSQEAESMYYRHINEYNEARKDGSNRLIIDRGEIYADSNKVNLLGESIDKGIDILANIKTVPGNIAINNPQDGYETNISYDKYISMYDNNEPMVAFEGEIYDDANSNIEIIDGAIWKKSLGKTSYNDLTETERQTAKQLYTSKLTELESDESIVLSKGKIYSSINSPDYNPLTDNIVDEEEIYIDEDSKTIIFQYNETYIEVIEPENFEECKNQYNSNKRIVIEPADIVTREDIKIQYLALNINDVDTDDKIYSYDSSNINEKDDCIAYINEYKNSGKITVKPARIYSKKDVTVTRKQLVVDVLNAYGMEVQKLIYKDNDEKYVDYLQQFETTGKIVITPAETYDISDSSNAIEIQDAHISITPNGSSKPVFDIYEKNNEWLFNKYRDMYDSNKEISILYNVDDVTVNRANITIKDIDKDKRNVIYDNTDLNSDGKLGEYVKYRAEYEKNGIVTFQEAEMYTANEITVTDPSVAIYNKDTNELLEKYQADYTLSDSSRYTIYNNRVNEWNKNKQIIDRKEVVYKDGENCEIKIGHVVNEERITDLQIVNKLFSGTGITKEEYLQNCLLGNGDMYNSLSYLNQNSYIMNEGDKVIVTVKNRNKTIASSFYSMFTANVGVEDIAKVYVNYGGTIKNNGETLVTESKGLVYSKNGRMFGYTGMAEQITLEAGKYSIKCWGASGGGNNGGKGAYASADVEIIEDMTLYVYVGSKGTEYSDTNTNNGGYNGGGNSYNGCGGGGATDVRLLKGEPNDIDSLVTRIIVAGGGGGSSKVNADNEQGAGGYAGNLERGGMGGLGNLYNDLYEGLGATNELVSIGHNSTLDELRIHPAESGNFGIGGSVDFDGAGAGGAGYYGGSAAHTELGGGGGGLSYVYDNQFNYYKGNYYPIPSLVADILSDVSLAKLIEQEKYLDQSIFNFVRTSNADVKAGNQEMDNPITYTGSSKMIGNTGDGCVIIKKID